MHWPPRKSFVNEIFLTNPNKRNDLKKTTPLRLFTFLRYDILTGIVARRGGRKEEEAAWMDTYDPSWEASDRAYQGSAPEITVGPASSSTARHRRGARSLPGGRPKRYSSEEECAFTIDKGLSDPFYDPAPPPRSSSKSKSNNGNGGSRSSSVSATRVGSDDTLTLCQRFVVTTCRWITGFAVLVTIAAALLNTLLYLGFVRY